MLRITEKKYVCVVCGKKFPEGQGIVIKVRDITLAFHKKTCFVRFFKSFIDVVDPGCFDKYAKKILAEYEEFLKKKTVSKRFLEES